MAIRERECLHCGACFSYTTGRGIDRKYCTDVCRVKAHQLASKVRLSSITTPCCVAGCTGKATRVAAGMCEAHYCLKRRTGRTVKDPVKGRYAQSAGYVLLLRKGHPLANKQGKVYEHRAVAYHANCGLCPPCYWCGVDEAWSTCHVDHLDENKANNSADNLVVACARCNIVRGKLMGMVVDMLPDSFEVFVARMRQQRCVISQP